MPPMVKASIGCPLTEMGVRLLGPPFAECEPRLQRTARADLGQRRLTNP
jgi:hypothetical protein